jgi:hypothetical protein
MNFPGAVTITYSNIRYSIANRYAMTAIAHVIISLVSAPGIEVGRRELIVPTAELARERP